MQLRPTTSPAQFENIYGPSDFNFNKFDILHFRKGTTFVTCAVVYVKPRLRSEETLQLEIPA